MSMNGKKREQEKEKENQNYKSAKIKQVENHLKLVRSCIKVLETQKSKAIKDIEFIENRTEQILKDPIDYILQLENGTASNMPLKQKIVGVPNINKDGALDWLFKPNLDTKIEKVEPISEDELQPKETLSITHNIPWTEEENRKLIELLEVYPKEDVALYRYEKIAKVMVTRTAKQVQSRIQKLSTLTKDQDPGYKRILELISTKKKRGHNKRTRYTDLSLRKEKEKEDKKKGINTGTRLLNAPLVYMSEDNEDDKPKSTKVEFLSNLNEAPTTAPNTVPPSSPQNSIHSSSGDVAIHIGFKCANCQIEPIIGPRWNCIDCDDLHKVNLCDKCVLKTDKVNEFHTEVHRLQKFILPQETNFIDADYLNHVPENVQRNYLSTW